MSPRPRSLPLPATRRLAAAVITAFIIALVTHVVTVFVFFLTNGAAAANILPISTFFLPTTLLLFVVSALVALPGTYARWGLAAAVGLVIGVAVSLLGTLWAVVSSGVALDGQGVGFVIASLGGTSLLYIVTTAVVSATAGRHAWLAVLASRPHRVAFIRQPSSRLAEGQVTHVERVELDETLADEQWEAYVAAMLAAGFETVELPVADDHPDSVFIEDAVVVLGGTAIITRPGAVSRRGETDTIRPLIRRAGLRIAEIVEPGTLDGGDVLVVGETIYVGRGGRTNADGIRQLRQVAVALGFSVVTVPVTKVLHLKSAVTALPDGTVVGHPDDVDDRTLFSRFLAMPEHGAAVVVLSEDTVLMAESVVESRALVASLGYQVVSVDVSEFEKLEGCVTCLSVRLG